MRLQEFYKASGDKTRLGVLQSTGHQQFLDAGWLLNRGFDWLCKAGSRSRRVSVLLSSSRQK